MKWLLVRLPIIFFYLWMLPAHLRAQVGNEWLVPNQNYYKLSIVESGIYRLSYAYLQGQGVPVLSADPKFLQVWRRGKQLPIYVSGEADGVLNAGDYVEFYATGNDGALEAPLYESALAQTHPYLSLYSDTAAYFLYFGSQPGLRMPVLTGTFNKQASYHWAQVQRIYADGYSDARDPSGFGGSQMPKPSFAMSGEGWVGADFTGSGSTPLSLTVTSAFTSGPQPRVYITSVGRSPATHLVSVSVTANTGSSEGYTGALSVQYQKTDLQFSLTTLGVLNGVNAISVQCFDALGASALSRVVFQYPQNTIFTGLDSKTFRFAADQNADFARIINVPNGSVPILYTDLYHQYRPSSIVVGSQWDVPLLTDSSQNVLVATSNALKVPVKVTLVQVPAVPSTANYIIISHKRLMQIDAAGINQVRRYAAYRASAVGGGHDTLVLTMDDVYNLFSYGETNYLALRNLNSYMLKTAISKPRYMFLLGQGIAVNYIYNNQWARFNPSILNNPANTFYNFVPTIGYPPSDIYYAQGLGSDTYSNPVFVGRYAARNAADISNYLNKVIEFEALPNDLLWRKNMLFLSGGRTVDQVETYKSFINELATQVQGPLLGARTQTLSKNTPLNTEFVDVSSQVNNGLSVLYSIGHTSQTYFDVNIGFASDPAFNYSNKLKYPFLYVNGCSSGNIFFSNSLGLDWITAPNKGAIAFLAHTDVGADAIMHNYAKVFFGVAYGDTNFLGRPISEIQSEANKRFMATNAPVSFNIAQTQQFVLQADPAIRLFNPAKTDYATLDANLSVQAFNGQILTSRTDSFALQFRVFNYGAYVTDSLRVRVTRTLADGRQITYGPQVFASVARDTTLLFIIQNKDKDAFGYTKWELCVNFDRSTPESNYANNCAVMEMQLPLNGVQCLFPPEYGIVKDSVVQFVAQSGNLRETPRDYMYEIDTLHTFNSPARIQGVLTSGGLVRWNSFIFQNLSIADSTVFFWRIRFKEPRSNEEQLWGTSSFIYIRNSTEGWSQALFPQFSRSVLKGVQADTTQRKWSFPQKEVKLTMATAGAQVPGGCGTVSVQFDIPVVYNQNACGMNFRFGCDGVIAIPIDQYTLAPYTNFNVGNPGNTFTCRTGHTVLASYGAPANFNYWGFLQLLDQIPQGDYLLLISTGNSLVQNWAPEWANRLRRFGATSLLQNQNQAPFIFIGQKGGNALLQLGPDTSLSTPVAQQQLQTVFSLRSNSTQGAIASTSIGPATEWGMLGRVLVADTNLINDRWQLYLYGRGLNNRDSLLLRAATPAQYDLKSVVAASKFPYLRLEAHLSDSAKRTPSQLKKWQVNYTGVPEGTLVFDPTVIDTGQYRITPKEQGTTFKLRFAFKNISPRPFTDTLMAQIQVQNAILGAEKRYQIRLKPLLPDSIVFFEQEIQTANLFGENTIQVFVNPRLVPELSYSNNLYTLPPFKVFADQINPILDVTFDGRHIRNNDIVSANALIVVSLRDDSKINFKTDTSGMTLLLLKPCDTTQSCTYERLNLTGPQVEIQKGTLQNGNTYQVRYQAVNWPSGMYTFKANGADATGNRAGVSPYEVRFRVENASGITYFFAYPNPFSSSCSFVYTLTGLNKPDDVAVHIYDVSGRWVRTLTSTDIQPIEIGYQTAQLVWDGTDSKGSKMPSGMYFYAANVRWQGQELPHIGTENDGRFKNRFGKLVLIR